MNNAPNNFQFDSDPLAMVCDFVLTLALATFFPAAAVALIGFTAGSSWAVLTAIPLVAAAGVKYVNFLSHNS